MLGGKKRIKQINRLIKTDLKGNKNIAYCIGYKALGPLMLGFCMYIHNVFESAKGNKELVFLARDGYLPKKCYEKIYGGDQTYFKVSRKSLTAPAMGGVIDLNALTLPPLVNIETLAKSIHIKEEDIRKYCENNSIPTDFCVKRNAFYNDETVDAIINNFKKEFIDYSKEQMNNYEKYLNDNICGDDIYIVDAGWHNSIQNLMIKSDRAGRKYHGIYLGVYSDAKSTPEGMASDGYIFNKDNKKEYKVFSFVSVMEMFLLANEGSCIEYGNIKGKSVPVLGEYEYLDETKLSIIKDIQKGAMHFVEKYKQYAYEDYNSEELASFSDNIIKLGTSPSRAEVETLSSLSFENYTIRNIVNYNGIKYYFLHPTAVFEDFYNSGWRIVFLKRLLKFPLPYNLIFKQLCKLKK